MTYPTWTKVNDTTDATSCSYSDADYYYTTTTNSGPELEIEPIPPESLYIRYKPIQKIGREQRSYVKKKEVMRIRYKRGY